MKLMYDYKLSKYDMHALPYVGLQRISGLREIDSSSFSSTFTDSEVSPIGRFSAGLDLYVVMKSGLTVRASFGTDGITSGLGYSF